METSESPDFFEDQDKELLIKEQPFDYDDESPSQTSKKPKAFNEALLRWALYRVHRNTLTVADIRQGKLWQPVSHIVLLIFFMLFAVGFWWLQVEYKYASGSFIHASHLLAFHCICCIVYTIAFIRGIWISHNFTVLCIVLVYLRCSGGSHEIVYSENGAQDEVSLTDDLK